MIGCKQKMSFGSSSRLTEGRSTDSASNLPRSNSKSRQSTAGAGAAAASVVDEDVGEGNGKIGLFIKGVEPNAHDNALPLLDPPTFVRDDSRGSLRASKSRLKGSFSFSYRSLDASYKDKGFWTSMIQDERMVSLSNYALLVSLCTFIEKGFFLLMGNPFRFFPGNPIGFGTWHDAIPVEEQQKE